MVTILTIIHLPEAPNPKVGPPTLHQPWTYIPGQMFPRTNVPPDMCYPDIFFPGQVGLHLCHTIWYYFDGKLCNHFTSFIMGNSFFILSPLNQRLNTIQSPLIKKSTRLLVDICLPMQYHHCYHWKDYVNKETGLVTLHAVKSRVKRMVLIQMCRSCARSCACALTWQFLDSSRTF